MNDSSLPADSSPDSQRDGEAPPQAGRTATVIAGQRELVRLLAGLIAQTWIKEHAQAGCTPTPLPVSGDNADTGPVQRPRLG